MKQVKVSPFQELNIDFSHRMPAPIYEAYCHHDLLDAINQVTDRATGILHMLAGQFISIEGNRLSDDIMYSVLMSAVREIEDVSAIVSAFSDIANKQTLQNQQA